jgi:hypothetical protein
LRSRARRLCQSVRPRVRFDRVLLELTVSSLLALTGVDHASAKPTAPTIVCESYPDAPECAGQVVRCTLCHEAIDPPTWNPFGAGLKDELASGVPFEDALPEALATLESDDADGDGVSNLAEIGAGTRPGVAEVSSAEPDDESTANPRFRLDGYDLPFAFRRVHTLYCGRSPSYEDLQAFADGGDEQTMRARLHEALATCLQSDYWQRTLLPRLADKRIKPLVAAGPTSQIYISSLRLVIGDYDFDYRLWRFVLSNDRDMRELLTADYHVLEGKDGSLTQTREVLPRPDPKALAGGQPLAPELRAGMITTQWFLTINTMFSALPRTTAAQAYRSYLGADISSSEGLMPVAGEPSDVDKKGVAQPRCANCHSTLDPLAYAFMKYEGIQVSADLKFGAYRPERASERIPAWDDQKQQPFVLGQPVEDLVAWARVAAESDQFARNMAQVFFLHALGRTPEATDEAEFKPLWQSLREDGYSANRLLHRLVDTQLFGAP